MLNGSFLTFTCFVQMLASFYPFPLSNRTDRADSLSLNKQNNQEKRNKSQKYKVYT